MSLEEFSRTIQAMSRYIVGMGIISILVMSGILWLVTKRVNETITRSVLELKNTSSQALEARLIWRQAIVCLAVLGYPLKPLDAVLTGESDPPAFHPAREGFRQNAETMAMR